ncbi:MAG: pentapeptide repeat-containing protein [Methanocorpusculum sp.]|uniref:pentapeptide repeat-containing protein n=1 Tax=unclassified Methanocorpusculum TaxID=225464 RepID=UPI001432899C|nr:MULTISPECIES: pentapeptide repeat-containing protein [unclassified Methanocorpusculum]MEA5086904.1 pentapeptide repeat-containing protein [Methanocorpusculum sp.]
MKKPKFDAKQYAMLRECSGEKDFTRWNAWYAVHLKETMYLRSSDAYGAHLEGGDLAYWFLEGADLRFANLRNADLSYSYLKSADLSYANLAGANLWRAYLSRAVLDGANPDAAVYDSAGKIKCDPAQVARLKAGVPSWNAWYAHEIANKPDDTRVFGAYLEEASFVGLDLSGVHLSYAHLEGADLRHVNFTGADLTHAHLEGADLWKADLTGADLRFAELGGANLAGAVKVNTLF